MEVIDVCCAKRSKSDEEVEETQAVVLNGDESIDIQYRTDDSKSNMSNCIVISDESETEDLDDENDFFPKHQQRIKALTKSLSSYCVTNAIR